MTEYRYTLMLQNSKLSSEYKTNVALLFLYKGLNPFIEEIEEGFKHDIYFFQDEIYSFINNGDFFWFW